MKINDIENYNFTWGETVLIKKDAPSKFQPGKIASVCSITKVNNSYLAEKYDSQIGALIYLVEFKNGKAITIPEKYLEKYNPKE